MVLLDLLLSFDDKKTIAKFGQNSYNVNSQQRVSFCSSAPNTSAHDTSPLEVSAGANIADSFPPCCNTCHVVSFDLQDIQGFPQN